MTFTLEYDASKKVAVVDGETINMAQANVVLVDDVDSPSGPRVSGTMMIESRMPGSAGQIGLVLRGSPEIMAFLRCDAEAADGRAQAVLQRMCLHNIGIDR
jgi:hypothetical protein